MAEVAKSTFINRVCFIFGFWLIRFNVLLNFRDKLGLIWFCELFILEKGMGNEDF